MVRINKRKKYIENVFGEQICLNILKIDLKLWMKTAPTAI